MVPMDDVKLIIDSAAFKAGTDLCRKYGTAFPGFLAALAALLPPSPTAEMGNKSFTQSN